MAAPNPLFKDIAEPAAKLCAVWARSRNRVIGRDGDLPWRLSSDLKHFKRLTHGKPCLMGRKTWESLPGVLPGRPHLVLTRDAGYAAKGAQVFTDLHAMVARGFELAGERGVDEVMVIGGAQIYKALLPHTDIIFETIVDAEVDGDARLPELQMDDWAVRNEKRHEAGPRDDFPFTTRTLMRLKAQPHAST